MITTLFIALSLAMDAFSVCVAGGVRIGKPTFRHYFRFSFHFGLFQFLMPVLGYFGGVFIQNFVSRWDHWIAFGVLSFIGLKMLWESFKQEHDETAPKDPSRGVSLVMLSIATSIDAAAVGFSFAALGTPVFQPAVIIGIICAACSAAGLYLGQKIGSAIGSRAERLGGVILVLIGVKILIEHILR